VNWVIGARRQTAIMVALLKTPSRQQAVKTVGNAGSAEIRTAEHDLWRDGGTKERNTHPAQLVEVPDHW